MAREVFTRTKPHVNVGTIGHIGHGKTTLTAAIVARQAHRFGGEAPGYAAIAIGGKVRDGGKIVTITAAHVEYETATRHYGHVDCPGHADSIKNMITGASLPTAIRHSKPPAGQIKRLGSEHSPVASGRDTALLTLRIIRRSQKWSGVEKSKRRDG